MEWTLWFWLGGAATFHISMDPSPVLVSLGSDVLLQCIFPAVGKDMPTPTVFWHHGQWRLAEYDGILVTQRPGTELPESAEGLRKGNASLLLRRVAMADLGSYYCTVTVGEQQAEAGVLLEISGSDLQIYTEPDSWVTMGSSALLKCRFSIGDVIELSSLTIRWYAPGGRIVAQFPPKEEEEEEENDVGEGPGGLTTLGSFSEADLLLGNASLTILRAQPKDAGLYSCSVGYGAAPHISLFPVQVSLGEKTTLLCQIKGFYPARGLQAWWLRNGQKLPEAISMGSPTQNPDGTFDLELILNLTLESHDLEANFTCHVTHPALEHPLQQILDMKVKEEKWWEDVQSNNRPLISSILITTLGVTVIGFAIIHSLRRNRGLEEEEQEQGEVRTATDGEDREQPQETSDFQSPGRNWEVEKLLPRDHTESEGEILQGDRKAGFLQGYRKTVGLMEVRYSRIKRQIIVECRETEEDKILVLEGTREGQVLEEKGESKVQNLKGDGESEGRVLEEFEVDTETQFQEAKAIRAEGNIIKGNRELEVHKRNKEATEKQNGEGQTEKRDAERQTQRGRDNGLTQGGAREGLTQGGDSEGQIQGGDSEGQTQGGDSEGQIQGGDNEGQTQRGDSEGLTQGEDSKGLIRGGDSEGLTQGGDAEGLTQGGDAEGLTQGGDGEGLTQGGDSEELTQGGDSEELTQGGDSEELTQGGDGKGLTQGGDSKELTQGGDSEGLTRGGDSERLIHEGNSERLTQGGDSEGLTREGDSKGLTQGGDSKGLTQGRDSEGLTRGGGSEGLTRGGDSEGLTRGGNSEGLTRGGDSERLTHGGESERLTQEGDSEGQIQGGDSEEEIPRRDAQVQVHLGDEEAIKGLVFKEVGRNGTRRIAGEGEAMEQIPSGYERIEGWTASGKIDTQSLRIDEDLSEQSPGAIGDRGSSQRRRHCLTPGIDGEIRGAEK
ncbi:uncharacterized protein LOC127555923 isoform X2 [Antechinus flavipes]|uniref:uncharacterized protein LOC127555923 isoform X2 n=1 Tax=Antechinus flavipes TaxID=38775 RepID=UPI0022355F49|nr:uncharacterized protein LOC127555923 isoform X2 [Antechinus flavipes]